MDRINDPSGADSSVGETPSSAIFSDGSKTKDDPKSLYRHMIHPCTPGIPTTYIPRNRRMDRRKSMMIKKTQRTLMNPNMMYKKSRGYYYNPLLYYKRNIDKTYYYKYFKSYSHDHRLLISNNQCQCPKGKIHDTNCPWYNPDIIYILDTKGDLSIIEQAAKQKIYQMYQNTLNNPPESCGCGTAAENCLHGTQHRNCG